METKAMCSLQVVVVGAGIGGVAAAIALGCRGHQVTVLENAPKLLEIGAGIQVAPNMLRILDRWGIGDEIRAKGVKTQRISTLRWENGKVLASTLVDETYGEQWVIHRADLHNALVVKAKSLDTIMIRLDSTVVNIDFEQPSVQLSSGEVVMGDLIIAADGIKSLIRDKMIGKDAGVAIPTGDAVFRLMLRRDQMIQDEDLRPFIEETTVRRWIGPYKHVVAYPVRNHQLYNIVMPHPDRGDVDEIWTKRGSKIDVIKEYEGWDPLLLKMLHLVRDEEVLEWRLCTHIPLKTWVRGSCALIGDACHPMLPYVAQGAAQAVEDAAALGAIFSLLQSKPEIAQALRSYELTRKDRAEAIQGFGTETRISLHLPDGPEQTARDLALGLPATPDRWTDAETRKYIWGCDAEQEATTLHIRRTSSKL